MMKKLVIKIIMITMGVCIANTINAQYQSVFGNVHTSWNVYDYATSLPVGITGKYVACCDTFINSKNYKKIDFYVPSSSGGFTLTNSTVFIREDTTVGRVWEITPYDTINEYLLANMSLSLTDSFEFPSGQYFDVDSIFVKNGRKHIQLEGDLYAMNSEKFTMIEGIVSNVAPVSNAWHSTSYLLCSHKDSNVAYQNTNIFFENQCILTSVNEHENNTKMNIYPNPSTNSLTIANLGQQQVITIEIRSVTGQVVHSQKEANFSKTTVNTSNIPVGVYWVNIKAGQQNLATQKWVKVE